MHLKRWKRQLLSGTALAMIFNFIVVGQAAVGSSTFLDFVAGPPPGCNITGKAPEPPLLPECPEPVQHSIAIIPVSESTSGTLTYNYASVAAVSGTIR
jgi:hypothetical protein